VAALGQGLVFAEPPHVSESRLRSVRHPLGGNAAHDEYSILRVEMFWEINQVNDTKDILQVKSPVTCVGSMAHSNWVIVGCEDGRSRCLY